MKSTSPGAAHHRRCAALSGVLLASAASTAGCAGSTAPAPVTSTVTITATSTVAPSTVTVTETETKTATVTVDAPTPTTETPSAEETIEVPQTGTVSLSDFVETYPWEEGRFNVASVKDVQGIATSTNGCAGDLLELRLENGFDTLSFTAGQANDSVSSGEIYTVQVLGNGAQLEVFDVPFNFIQPFTVDVGGVNALQILADPVECDSATLVLMDLELG